MLIYNYYVAILILAIIFYFISNKKPSILIAIIIIIIIGYNYLNIINNYNLNLVTNYENQVSILENNINEKIYYLNNDKFLIELLLNIRFIKIFDNDKYSNIIKQTEKLMKLYIFMLGNRYDFKDRFSSFLYIRRNIINEIYSSYIIVPEKLKFIYGFNPYDELKITIENFIKHTRKMILILEKYAYEKKEVQYLEDTKYKPYSKDNNIDNNIF